MAIKHTISVGVHDSPSEAQALYITQFREIFDQHRVDFGIWSSEVVFNMPREEIDKLIRETLEKISVEMENAQVVISSSGHSYVEGILYAGGVLPPEPNIQRLMGHEVPDLAPAIFKVYISTGANGGDPGDYYDDDDDEIYTEGGVSNGSTIVNDVLVGTVDLVGDPASLAAFRSYFLTKIKEYQTKEKVSLLKWNFSSEHGVSSKVFQVKKDWVMDRSFYPWIPTSLDEYYKAYLASKAQILVLYGIPGSGKTSFIRDFGCETGKNLLISYDMKVLTSDRTFVNHLTNSIFNVIVIEDADDLLTSGRGDHNKVISKILNISDGLIKLPKKKLIFTTNLKNVSDIDPAIIRPGRCFDVMEFREMSRTEAEAVLKFIGGPALPVADAKKTYTLAQLFALKEEGELNDPYVSQNRIIKSKVGFY